MPSEEPIERLLRLADPGPEIPAGGETRIKAAVRPLWRQQVRRRAVRRTLFGAAFASAAAAALFVIVVTLRGPEPAPAPVAVARVELVRGPADASLQHTPLFTGARPHTQAGSRAALRLFGGASLRMDSATAVRLLSAHVIELERGAVYVDSGGLHTAPIEVRTRFGNVRDVGTRFEVRVEDHLLVRVREGSVDVAGSARRFRVNAGSESTIEADGSQELRSIVADAASWTAAIAPPFPIEGRSVAALLDWCSRESGLAVHYRDAAAERAARTTLLHGSADGLEPVEAVEAILPTAGLRARRGNGEVVVEVPRQ